MRSALPPIPRPWQRHRGAILGLIAACATMSCQWYGYVPRDVPKDPAALQKPALPLVLGEPHAATLDCNSGHCDDWYQINMTQSGELHLAVRFDADLEGQNVRVVLQSLAGTVLANRNEQGAEELTLSSRVESGRYLALVQAGGQELRYQIVARVHRSGSVSTPAGTTAPGTPSSASAPPTVTQDVQVGDSGQRNDCIIAARHFCATADDVQGCVAERAIRCVPESQGDATGERDSSNTMRESFPNRGNTDSDFLRIER